MSKKLKLLVSILALGVIALGLVLYFTKDKSDRIILYGNVDQRQVELAFKDAERVAEVLVQEGDFVEKGQVLARLETRRLEDKIKVLEAKLETAMVVLIRLENGTRPEEIAQAKASVVAAEAELAYADQQFKRYKKIWDQSGGSGVSRQDLDSSRMSFNLAKAKLDMEQKGLELAEIGPRWEDIAEARAELMAHENNLTELKNQLADAELISPNKSVIRRRLLEPGDMASPQKAVFSLAVLSPKWVRAYISESELGLIKYGDKAMVYTDSHPNEGLESKVGFISSVAEFTPKTVQTTELRTSLVYEVRLYLEDKEDRLRLGMPVTVTFPDL